MTADLTKKAGTKGLLGEPKDYWTWESQMAIGATVGEPKGYWCDRGRAKGLIAIELLLFTELLITTRKPYFFTYWSFPLI